MVLYSFDINFPTYCFWVGKMKIKNDVKQFFEMNMDQTSSLFIEDELTFSLLSKDVQEDMGVQGKKVWMRWRQEEREAHAKFDKAREEAREGFILRTKKERTKTTNF